MYVYILIYEFDYNLITTYEDQSLTIAKNVYVYVFQWVVKLINNEVQQILCHCPYFYKFTFYQNHNQTSEVKKYTPHPPIHKSKNAFWIHQSISQKIHSGFTNS